MRREWRRMEEELPCVGPGADIGELLWRGNREELGGVIEKEVSNTME